MTEGFYMEEYSLLAAAVVRKAVEDYKNALKRVRRRPDDIGANKIIIDCESFFQNEISIYSDLDGMAIMDAVRKQADMEG